MYAVIEKARLRFSETRMKTVVAVLCCLCSFTFHLRADDKPLVAPRPSKDADAIARGAQGAGVFVLTIDKPSGRVKCVTVERSTRNVLLDADTINTLLQWRFQPNKESSVTIPIMFTRNSPTANYPVGDVPFKYGRRLPGCFTAPITRGVLWQRCFGYY